MLAKIYNLCTQFGIVGKLMSTKVLHGGNINTTILVEYEIDKKMKNFILQKINKYVFPNPPLVMANISKVTAYIKGKLSAKRTDVSRRVLNFYLTQNGKSFVIDEEGEYWRLCDYVENSISFNSTTDNQLLKEAGKAFGNFQRMLDGFPSESLGQPIKNFHNVPLRFDKLRSTVRKDECNRASLVEREIKELFNLEKAATEMARLLKQGLLPLRVTHNDTKCNNVLFDADTKKHLCVIDLDTVMPGLIGYDYGDAVRSACCTTEEDEKDLSKVRIDLEKLTSFTEGFIGKVGRNLIPKERETLSLGAITMTIELAVRFLTDYLEGDKYFKIDYEEHNLIRARCQLALAKDMINNYTAMQDIVEESYDKLSNEDENDE